MLGEGEGVEEYVLSITKKSLKNPSFLFCRMFYEALNSVSYDAYALVNLAGKKSGQAGRLKFSLAFSSDKD